MPLKNPFAARRTVANTGVEPNNENARPDSIGIDTTFAPKESLALGIKGSRDQPNEFKLSAVNDSGVYLPPSPPEKRSFWHKSPTSTTSSNHRSALTENEPFSISRESFESYRRSFDISGRSPIQADGHPSRTSLDSRAAPRLSRSAINGNTFQKPASTAEEGFEDVGLQDDPKPKKKSFLSRTFGETGTENPSAPVDGAKSTPMHGFHIPGRKRGTSGVGSELGDMPRRGSKGKADGVIR